MDDSLFFRRKSRRSYSDKPIPADALNRIHEKTRWSPSCSNKQPWRFIFVSDPEQHKKLMDAMAEGNAWASRAPVLAVVCAREEDDVTRED
ncbi:MAG: nitroreductase family protein, partial [candidate division Zixibacteria bacterium]|nr:nitroreductase family protein [candidate division Zixibacteria bacterium]